VDINFNTDRLLILNYLKGSGGKFISLCLNIHPKVLPQHETLARAKMTRPTDTKFGFDIAARTFDRSRADGKHFELGGGMLAGFNFNHMAKDTNADKQRCNDLWKELTNNNDHYFVMDDHTDKEIYSRYVNRKTLILKNYEWILQARNPPSYAGHGIIDSRGKNENYIKFDMASIKTKRSFREEIGLLFDFVGLEFDSYEYLEELRKLFLATFKIGFNNKEEV